MSIQNVVFPLSISQGSSGGPGFRTDIATTLSGKEYRDSQWSQSRHAFVISQGVKDQADFESLKAHFMAVKGQWYGFLFQDPGDYKSCDLNSTISATDQDIGSGDGSTAAFQLIKDYTSGLTHSRTIYRTDTSSVLVAIDGTAITGGWSVSATTGLVTFDSISLSVTDATDNGDGTTRLYIASHGLVTNDSVYLTTFTGGWAGLNDTRFIATKVNDNEIDVDFDSSAYSAYLSNGGQIDTLPQTGEAVTAGFEFYIPVRFSVDEMQSTFSNFQSYDTNLGVIEIRNDD